ncbi:MAG: chemoreceptor glutamine deamidase CheD [Gemmatimonadales bacterium]|nr:chemoreceptor glutamine deamidase CheD [Gemmatimonadales bacterium]
MSAAAAARDARPGAGLPAVQRYRDPRLGRAVAKLLPGEFAVTSTGEVLVTALGSCVAACVRDPVAGVAGMNHFMLPEDPEHGDGPSGPGLATRYGNHAMERLLNELLKRGGRRERLEVKLTGGGRVLAGMTDVGQANIAFVRRYLRTEGLAVLAEDLGGTWPRKVYYDAVTGRLRVKYLRRLANDTIAERERAYRGRLRQEPAAGPIDLFDS